MSGDEEIGIRRLLDIISTSSSDTLALHSANEIIQLREKSSTPLTGNETVLIASVFVSHNKMREARRLIDRYFSENPAGTVIGRAHFERGRIRYIQKRYNEAVEDFSAAFLLIKDPKLIRESRLYIARSMYYSGNYMQAEQEYDRYAREYPLDNKAAEALWIIALNYERRNELLKAAEAYQRVASKNAPNNYRFRALFKIGFSWYKSDFLIKSRQYFKKLQSLHPGTSLALQAAFWEAKSLEKLELHFLKMTSLSNLYSIHHLKNCGQLLLLALSSVNHGDRVN